MKRILGFGLVAAVSIWGCSSSGDDTGNQGSGGAAPLGSGGAIATTGSGGKPSTTGSGGSTTTMTGSGGKTGSGGMGAAGMGGAGGMVGTGGMGGTGGVVATTDGGMPPTRMPPCLTKGGDLVLIGDSYVNYIERLEPRLTTHATTDGILTAPDAFDDHAVAGTSLSAGATATIPNQWFDEAKALKPKFVVMDGGGNDILLYNSQCLPDGAGNDMDAGCQQVVKDATAVAKTMLDDMKATGVAQVLYFFYPDVPAGGHDILAYSFPMGKASCEAGTDATFECTMIDLRPLFAGHADWVMALDGIHPTTAGMDAMGDFIWGVMKDHCMAQTTASGAGCCKP